MQNLTVSAVKNFYRNPKTSALRVAVLAAREIAAERRTHVDGYIKPLLAVMDLRDTKGEQILDTKWLFLCEDEDACTAFYAACDVAHREHGFHLEPGYCPALVAESNAINAENALIEAASAHFEVDFTRLFKLEQRRQLLDLLVNGVY